MCFTAISNLDDEQDEGQEGCESQNGGEDQQNLLELDQDILDVQVAHMVCIPEDDDEYLDDEFEEVSERISMAEDGANEILGGAHAIIDVEESAFGRKIRKRKKKMETRLLKEILNDVKSLRFK